jgi:suppressor for copper-sensitivity B
MRGKVIHIGLGVALLPLAIMMSAAPAMALKGDSQQMENTTMRLLSAADTVGQDQVIDGGLLIELPAGWHTYWRMPGESGQPPRFDWSGSKNVQSVNVLWPHPQRLEDAGFESFGYDRSVLLPLDIHPIEPSQSVILALKAEIAVCSTTCIPLHFNVGLTIPAGDRVEGAEKMSIQHARALVPHFGDTDTLKIKGAVVGPRGLVVETFSSNGYGDTTDLIAEVEGGNFYFTAKPEMDIGQKDHRQALMLLTPPANAGSLARGLQRHTVTITLLNNGQGVEKSINF